MSQYYEYNQYKRDFNQLITNDSIKILHESFGDVKFVTNKRKLNKAAANTSFKPDNVLLYGQTTLPPHYEYFVLVDSEKEISEKGIYTSDTLVNGHHYSFIGIPAADDKIPKDFERLSANFFPLEKEGDQPEKKPIGAFMNQFLKKNTYFHSMRQISKYETDSESEEWFRYQMELNYASFLGDSESYWKLVKRFEGNLTADSIVSTIQEKGVSDIGPVKDFVMKKVKGQQLIMFNENHFYPSHRKLLASLLPELKAAGFNYLAMEAIAEGEDKKLNKGDEVSFNTGFYTREQWFAELIRTAQKLGIQLVSYESQGKDRENGQADNLYNKTFKHDPKARVIVYAGISHILEKPDSRGKKWMATIFKEKYQINPVTFSQTGLLRYRKFVDEVCILTSSEFSSDRLKGVDYQVINNMNITTGKGNFRYINPFDFTIQLSVFENKGGKKSDSKSRVPIRVALLKKGEEFMTNLEGLEDVKLLLTNEGGIVVKEENMKVADR